MKSAPSREQIKLIQIPIITWEDKKRGTKTEMTWDNLTEDEHESQEKDDF